MREEATHPLVLTLPCVSAPHPLRKHCLPCVSASPVRGRGGWDCVALRRGGGSREAGREGALALRASQKGGKGVARQASFAGRVDGG
jgi:hypothetical protein